LAAFLDGYQAHCPLTAADLEAIGTFVAVRHFWFMGLRTANARHWGEGEVNDPALDQLVAFWRAWEPHLAAPG
jgi:Ser/Thr protein kinase RdoA (MazF antagonist)